MKLKALILGGFAALFALAAFAQSVPLPSALPLGPLDQVQIIKNGQPSAQSQYAPVGAVSGVQAYQNLGVIVTAQTFAVSAGVTNVFAQPAGTLAAVTLTAPANPSDGQYICFTSTQTTTALTLAPNSGQTVVNGTVAGVANAATCWTFVRPSNTWYIGG